MKSQKESLMEKVQYFVFIVPSLAYDLFILYLMINLIDQHGEFNERIYEFPNAQSTIAIFGSQSSGKSTLMNAAFGTNFPVLDSKKDRKRCTKGIWLMNNGKFNIIDTQGFDSIERSSDDRIYERQVALFCLAISDVIMVNIWMNEIGRYEGAQQHILRSIIKASTSLVKSQMKTIIFVVKDCSRDADFGVLKDELDYSIKNIISQFDSKTSIKFNIEYYFMSNYIYYQSEYEKQATKLSTLIKTRKSVLAQYEPKDRIVYLRHLWEVVTANDGEIDLRLEEEALRSFVVKRIRREVISHAEEQLARQNRLANKSTYERFYKHFIQNSFDEIRKKMPVYVDDKTLKQQFFAIEEDLGFKIQKHFTEAILPSEQEYLLNEHLDKQLRKSYQSIQLEKIISKKRKEVLQLYKVMVQGHKQSSILSKRFSQKITEASVLYERQVSHLFNMFESKLEDQINKQLDKQIKTLTFEGEKITKKIKEICKKFQYNQWELNLRQIWERASHRILTHKMGEKVQQVSSSLSYSMFADSKQTEIISFHKNILQKCQNFTSQLLEFFDQPEAFGQYIEKTKQKVREALDRSIIKDRKRFKVTLIMIGIFLIFFYGEFLYMLKKGAFKKKSKRYLRYFYMILVTLIIVGGIIKRRAQYQRSQI